MLCHGTVCVVGKMRDLILQLSKSSIYSTKPSRAASSALSNCSLIFIRPPISTFLLSLKSYFC
ncbi:hypothetical protein B4U27_02595 [Klebsiella pneumoniae]|nr:hypothetical protein B4U28_01975 [Klebsiella pneumoniae]PVW70632.1 hypothetical protein B4U27_02595 [Klebsiella pneumoniae]